MKFSNAEQHFVLKGDTAAQYAMFHFSTYDKEVRKHPRKNRLKHCTEMYCMCQSVVTFLRIDLYE